MTAVVFDLDGTLIDSIGDIVANANVTLGELGLAPLPPDQIKGFVGNGVVHFLTRLLEAAGAGAAADVGPEAVLARFNARYESDFSHTRLYPDVIEALEALAGMGCALGVCTNKPLAQTHAVLRHLKILHYFPVVYGGDSLPQRKPDPAPLRATIADLGHAQAVFVGDSEVDAATAANAGLRFLLYTEGYRKTPVQDLPHDAAFDDFRDLPGLVAAMMKG